MLFKQHIMLMDGIIVGIDTGKTSAIACVDLSGRLVCMRTARFADLRWFVDSLKEAGMPVIIASDKKKAGFLVSKLASIFDAALFLPREDISISKKKAYAKVAGASNLHERDALSAAMSAYHSHSNKLKQAERQARERSIEDIDHIKALVIKKHSVYEAINKKKTARFVR